MARRRTGIKATSDELRMETNKTLAHVYVKLRLRVTSHTDERVYYHFGDNQKEKRNVEKEENKIKEYLDESTPNNPSSERI